jgi:hypothetical protein
LPNGKSGQQLLQIRALALPANVSALVTTLFQEFHFVSAAFTLVFKYRHRAHTLTSHRAQGSSVNGVVLSLSALFPAFCFELLDALIDLAQRILEVLRLLFQTVKLLFGCRCRGKGSGVRGRRIAPGRIAHRSSSPAGQARRVIPVSPAATAASAPAPVSAATRSVHITRH